MTKCVLSSPTNSHGERSTLSLDAFFRAWCSSSTRRHFALRAAMNDGDVAAEAARGARGVHRVLPPPMMMTSLPLVSGNGVS